MSRDLHHNLGALTVIAPQQLGTTGTGKAGKIIDRKGYEGVELVLTYGSVTATNATVIPVVKEGDATGAMTSVADANLLGLESNASIPQAAVRTSGVNKNVTRRIGYIGSKRYVTVNLVNTVSAAIVAGAVAILGNPHSAPVAT